jgi:cell division protein FtsB
VNKAQAAARPESLRPLIGAVILLFIVLLALAGLKGHHDLTLARTRERELTTSIDDTQANIERLRAKIERLKTDPATLERMAREELGMVRRADVVIELPANGELIPLPRPVAMVAPKAAPIAAPPPTASALQPIKDFGPVGPPAPKAQDITSSQPSTVIGPPLPVGPPLPPGFPVPSSPPHL